MSNLSCGIVGLPNVGKSTLFNALTSNEAACSNYPFCTIDPNVGIVNVPDPRLAILSQLSESQTIIPAAMNFIDIAGIVKGAAKGEGLGNKFLSNIRETDAIVHVVRCFDDDNVIHVAGRVNPIEDIEVINLELILADMQMVENILPKLQKQLRGDKEQAFVIEVLTKVKAHLDENKPLRFMQLLDEEREALNPYAFLTAKKVLYVANVSENDLPEMRNDYVKQVEAFAETEGSAVVPICANLEAEISQLDVADRQEMLESLDLKEPGLNRLIRASFFMLGLITFLTTGEKETRAWTIVNGSLAPEAAGKIHTDIQKGFIRAEVIKFENMLRFKGRNGAKEAGKLSIEGKDYVVLDGDVIVFLHN